MSQFAISWPRVTKRHGTQFTLRPADGGDDLPVVAHFVSPSPQDQALVNALGLEARVVHALPEPSITKFDKLIDPSGRQWSVEAVHAIWANEVLVGQKLYTR